VTGVRAAGAGHGQPEQPDRHQPGHDDEAPVADREPAEAMEGPGDTLQRTKEVTPTGIRQSVSSVSARRPRTALPRPWSAPRGAASATSRAPPPRHTPP